MRNSLDGRSDHYSASVLASSAHNYASIVSRNTSIFSKQKGPQRTVFKSLEALAYDLEESPVHRKSPDMLIFIDYIYVSANTIGR